MIFPILISVVSLLLGHDEAEIVFAGDAMMHQGQIEAALQSDGTYDYSEYFKEIQPYISMADYAVVNLETPISTPPYSGYPCFNAPESYIDALQNAGFDLFLTANNHTLDRRDNGVRNTIAALDRHNAAHIGTYINSTQRDSVIPNIKNINNIKVGFLNYTYGTNGIEVRSDVKIDYIDKETMRHDIELTRQAGAEIIIVCLHWGIEYSLLPHPSQKSLGKFLKDLGVDIIIGGHPHVIQPMELTETTGESRQLLIYSLGNFISNMKTTDTRGGALAKVTIRRDDNGKVSITDASYRLVYTEPANNGHNYQLKWVDDSNDPRAKAFSKSARNIFQKHNINVKEDIPGITRQILQTSE